MVTLERTRDMSLVKRIVTHPSVWEPSRDDFSGNPEDYDPPADGAVYVAVMYGDVARGVFALVPRTHIRYEIHTMLLSSLSAWRKMEAAAQMKQWVFANTPCQRLSTEVPTCNPAALGFAKHFGMEQSGIESKCFMRDGKLHDVIVLGLNREQAVSECR